MKQLLTTLMLAFISINTFGQIKTTEVEIRAATSGILNQIYGPTSVSGAYNVTDIPDVFFLVSPKMTSDGGQHYERGLRVLMTDAYGIPSGITDTGYRIGLDISAHANKENFQGTLQSQQGMRIQFGTNSSVPTGAINEVRGLNLQGLTSSNATIGKAYAIYQSGPTFQNYFEGKLGLGTENPEQQLHVEGDALIKSDSGAELNLFNTNANQEWQVVSGYNSGFEIGNVSDGMTDANAPFFITKSGNIGIGTTSPGIRLAIEGGTGVSDLSSGSGYVQIGPYEASHMSFDPNEIQVSSNGVAADLTLQKHGGRVGIGTASPSGNLHVRSGTVSGSISGNYDNLILEENGNVGLTLMAPGANNSGIAFADEDDPDVGRIIYQHNTDRMSFIVNNGEKLSIVNSNVGIGTSAPSEKLHVLGPVQVQSGIGIMKFDNIENDSDNGFVRGSIVSSRDGDLEWDPAGQKWTLGATSNSNDFAAILHTNPGQLQFFTGRANSFSEMDNDTFRSTFQRMTINGDGKVGIGTTSPGYRLDINGSIRFTSGGLNGSDRRWKKDITAIEEATNSINEINPVSYYWRIDEFPEKNFDDRLHHGVIAQELEEVLPELVSTDNEGYKSVDYLGMIGLLVKGFQERGEEIARLEKELTRFEREVDRLKKELSKKDLAFEARLTQIEKTLDMKNKQEFGENASQK